MSDSEERIVEEEQVEMEKARSRSPIDRTSRSRSRSPRRNRKSQPAPPFRGGKRVILRNIPYELRWQELKDMFRKEIGDVSYVEVLETPSGKSKGVAVVEFKDSENAKKAIEEFHQKKLNDRAIIVREEREKDRQEFMQSQNQRMNRGGHGDGPGHGRGGDNRGDGVLSQLGIDGPISSTVFVANLDYKVTWWKLKDVFKLAGNVVKAEIKEDKSGKSRGMGVCTFEHPMEAVQAVSMFNNQVLFDRKMIVRVDKAPEPERPKLPSGLKSIGMGLGNGGIPLTNFNNVGGASEQFENRNFMNMGGGLGGGGLMGMGGLGGSSGLGLLGAGSGDLGLGSLSGGLGGGLGGLGGFGGLGGSGSMGGAGLGMGDMGLGSKMGGLSDSYSGMGGSSLSGLGGMPGLNTLASGFGSLGNGDRLSMGGLDRLGMSDGMGRDRMGNDRMGSMDGLDRMSGRDRDSYGNGGSNYGGGNSYGGGRDNGRDMRGGEDRSRGGTTRPDNCTVIVKNIPYTTNWQNLKDHFRDAGDVKFAEIVMEKGRSTGVGYVRFANYEDAHRAIDQKHRSRLEKRNIDVALHRN